MVRTCEQCDKVIISSKYHPYCSIDCKREAGKESFAEKLKYDLKHNKNKITRV